MAEEASEARSGPLAELLAAHERLRRQLGVVTPYAVRMDVSLDIYDAMHAMANPLDRTLLGYAAAPRELTGVSVIIHYVYPVGSMGVTYSDGHVESFSF